MADLAGPQCYTIEQPLGHKITNRLDLCRADSAAATDKARAAGYPVMDIVGFKCRRPAPGFYCGIPALTAVGIDHDRLAGGLVGKADQGVRVCWIDAVDAYCYDLVDVPGEQEGLLRRLSGPRPVSGTGDRQPTHLSAAVDLCQ
jgi:hypothetical protein